MIVEMNARHIFLIAWVSTYASQAGRDLEIVPCLPVCLLYAWSFFIPVVAVLRVAPASYTLCHNRKVTPKKGDFQHFRRLNKNVGPDKLKLNNWMPNTLNEGIKWMSLSVNTNKPCTQQLKHKIWMVKSRDKQEQKHSESRHREFNSTLFE